MKRLLSTLVLVVAFMMLISCNLDISITGEEVELTIDVRELATGKDLTRSLSHDGYGRIESYELNAKCPAFYYAKGSTYGEFVPVEVTEDGVIKAGLFKEGLWNFILRGKDEHGNIIYQGSYDSAFLVAGRDNIITIDMDLYDESTGSVKLIINWKEASFIPTYSVSYGKLGDEFVEITGTADSNSNFELYIPDLAPGYYRFDVKVFGEYGELSGESISVIVLNGNITYVTGTLSELKSDLGGFVVEIDETKISGNIVVTRDGETAEYKWENLGTSTPVRYIWTINGFNYEDGINDSIVLSYEDYPHGFVSCIAVDESGACGSASVEILRIVDSEVDLSKDEEIEVDNDAVPSVSDVKSDKDRVEIVIDETEKVDFSSSHSIVGKVIDIKGDDFSQATLTFTVADEVAYDKDSYLVCRYNEDGTVDYYQNLNEDDTKEIKAEIDGTGTYYVLDVKALINEFGRLNGENEADPETVMAPADIAFLIDSTGSMYDEISSVKNSISSFATYLGENGISAALALIDYKDIDEDGINSTVVHKSGSKNWFYDVEEFKSELSTIYANGGGDTPESAIDVLETARLLDLRESASKFFILVTDASYKVANRYGIESMEEEINLLVNAGINCSVVTSSSYKSYYTSLIEETGGIYANIYGDIYSALLTIAENIGTVTVKDGYWIYLNGPVPTPVKLSAKPEVDSDVDTDGDGIPDIVELGSVAPTEVVDLDMLITLSSHGAITGTNYGKILSYKYVTNPIRSDI